MLTRCASRIRAFDVEENFEPAGRWKFTCPSNTTKVRYTCGQVCLIGKVRWPKELHLAESDDPASAVFTSTPVPLTGSSNRLGHASELLRRHPSSPRCDRALFRNAIGQNSLQVSFDRSSSPERDCHDRTPDNRRV
jgi:hypothetical protein